MEPSNGTLFLRLRKRVALPGGGVVRLGQIAQILAAPDVAAALHKLPVYTTQGHEGTFLLIDMLLIISKIKQLYPSLTVEYYGEPHTLVDLSPPEQESNAAMVALVCILLFIGSGLAIMNFHADVSMLKVHQRIYELLTGKQNLHPLLLQIPYSLGIGIGMIIFFNRIFKKKLNEEPNPLEVEMFMYQENVNHYIVTEEYRKLHAEDDSK